VTRLPSGDPETVRCPYCDAMKDVRCLTSRGFASRPHATRRRLALAVAAHADPALDAWPQLGPVTRCGICGVPELPQRHRMVDAMAERMGAGESVEEVAFDYRLPVEAVRAVEAWAARWPEAWK
jgi:hypothetical protein